MSEDSPFKLIGFYLYDEDQTFNRLPQKSDIEFPAGVKILAQHTGWWPGTLPNQQQTGGGAGGENADPL